MTGSPAPITQQSGLIGASRARFLVNHFVEHPRTTAVLCQDHKEAQAFQDDLLCFAPNLSVRIFDPIDALPYFQISPNPDILLDRLGVLGEIERSPSPFILLIPITALGRYLIPHTVFREAILELNAGAEWDRDRLIQSLIQLGYQRVPLVEDRGTFAVRGGIIDLFSPAHSGPVRIEFFGNKIDELRFFNSSSQKSTAATQQAIALPAREILYSHLSPTWRTTLKKRCDTQDIPKKARDQIQELMQQEIYFHGIETYLAFFYQNQKLATVLDYLPESGQVCFLDKRSLEQTYADFLSALETQHQRSTSVERIFSIDEIYAPWSQLVSPAERFSTINLLETAADQSPHRIHSNALLLKDAISTLYREKNLRALAGTMQDHLSRGEQVYLVASSPAQRTRLNDLLIAHGLKLATGAPESKPSTTGSVTMLTGNLSRGFYWEDRGEWWISDQEIFGQKVRRSRIDSSTEPFLSFQALAPGDYIVHEAHGVGRYLGLERLRFGSVENDFLVLQYQDGDRLYVPADQLDRVTRYNAQDGGSPALDKLGGYSWSRVREKVKRGTRKLARQLLQLQALRAASKGYAFSTSNELFEEFEATFPFTETDDQLRAINDVVQDMESEKPMDRLVCGDVGYGKTEVAIRAAFKAVLDQKQVAVLVPTTVLAFQHFNSFKQRLEKFAVKTAMLSRFQIPADQKKVLKALQSGNIDIIIGTHRLLSKDLEFSDLGLLIIDEEQHFGVTQKERIKQMSRLVDTLTLTATPIPRTLNFALTGIRDLSVIQTPPADRLAIRTYVIPFAEGTIVEAITREIKRGGQVYFVHNRIQNIQHMKQTLLRLMPNLSIEIGHGQMEEEQLERVMVNFMAGKFSVLLCTTIIESGLDIPSVNTIIINDADHFGLSQLYQLRGRVGRSNHRAYCYLICPDEALLTDVAKKRLRVIQKFTDLGSGFRIASHDLEIRGAGNILGAEQSGHIAAVGYDLYIKLLQDAVSNLKERGTEEEIQCEIKLPISASIPEELVPDPQSRLVLYKQLASLKQIDTISELKDEWLDRLGNLPESVINLMGLMRVKLQAKRLGIMQVSYQANQCLFKIHSQSPIPVDYWIHLAKQSPKTYKILPDGLFQARINSQSDRDLLDKISTFLSDCPVSYPKLV